MARLKTLLFAAFVLVAIALPPAAGGPRAAAAEQEPDRQLKEAGVCARCHVISVVEWGMSRHFKSGTNCVSCHGASEGHVADERNNVKPDKTPHGAAIGALCITCHTQTKRKTGCEECHHVHALVNPKKPSKTESAATAPAPVKPSPKPGFPREMTAAGVRFVLVEGGDVTMGSADLSNARPVHTVRVKPFYLAVAELTGAQWEAVLGRRQGAEPDLPVRNISWQDAQVFLAKLNGTAGGGFRLPTEAEWEFAARAGTAAGRFELDAPRKAGPPNGLGIADLFGNVWEWCSSLDRPFPYDASDGRESLSAPGLRVLKGGGYTDSGAWITAALRHADRPDRRLPWYGMRLARTPR